MNVISGFLWNDAGDIYVNNSHTQNVLTVGIGDELQIEHDGTDAVFSLSDGNYVFNDGNVSLENCLEINGSMICGWDEVNTTTLDAYCSTDGKILKRVAGTWICADDATGGGGSSNALNYTKDFDGVDKVTLSFYIPS